MLYVTPDDMKAIFEEQDLFEASNLRDSAANQVDDKKLLAACNGATGIINGWLMRRYTLPIANAPVEIMETLKIHAANIAFNLLDGSLEETRKKAEDAIAWLKMFTDSSTKGFDQDTSPGILPGERVPTIAFDICAHRTYANVRELF